MTTAVGSTPVTSWWYGQGGVVSVVRRLESLYTLTPTPAAAGLVTARTDELVVTFIDDLRAGLPHPWQPAESGKEARIGWGAADPGTEPDPHHPVYLVAFGTTDNGDLLAMNLGAFSRIQIAGDPGTARALISRWILELVATHPAITVGATADIWRGPWTTRVQPVHVGQVPHVDVLICGPDLSYTDRAQIVSHSNSGIMVDLGSDAAVDTKWTITVTADRVGELSNGQSRSMSAALIVPSADTVDRCGDLLTTSPVNGAAPNPAPPRAEPTPTPAALPPDAADQDQHGPDVGSIDFFAPQGDIQDLEFEDTFDEEPWPAPAAPAEPRAAELSAPAGTPPPLPAVEPPLPAAAAPAPAPPLTPDGNDAAVPVLAPIWNRLLGQVVLCPPDPGAAPGPREKRLNELTIFLQLNPWVDSSEIIRRIFGGGASDKTVTQQLSVLRTRLGVVRPGGPKALPPMCDGQYRLDSAVRSDWMEFERLVEILIETTATGQLVAAMDLVTGPPLGGVTPKEWPWTSDLRDEMRDRVAGAAVVLSRRHHDAGNFSDAVDAARKGLWYDTARQDLWQAGMQAALEGREHDIFKALRTQYLNAVAGPDRDPAVFDLTKQAG